MSRRTLFVGDIERAEFARLATSLQDVWHISFARNPAQAIAQTGPRDTWETILLAPSYRDEYSIEDVQQLQAQAPLADLLAVVGSWCEGETRSGRAWPGVRRVYLDQLLPWFQSLPHSDQNTVREPIAWLPPTLTQDERWLIQSERSCPVLTGRVVICAETRVTRDYLVELCQAAGLETLDYRPGDDVGYALAQAVVYDAVAPADRRDHQLRDLARRFQHPRILALVNFPRADEIEHLRRRGATWVLGKPFVIDDFFHCLGLLPAVSAIQAA